LPFGLAGWADRMGAIAEGWAAVDAEMKEDDPSA
jgi:hypothetical protein